MHQECVRARASPDRACPRHTADADNTASASGYGPDSRPLRARVLQRTRARDGNSCSRYPAIATRLRHSKVLAARRDERTRSEEHTSELQSLMRTSYAVFCLKKKYE